MKTILLLYALGVSLLLQTSILRAEDSSELEEERNAARIYEIENECLNYSLKSLEKLLNLYQEHPDSYFPYTEANIPLAPEEQPLPYQYHTELDTVLAVNIRLNGVKIQNQDDIKTPILKQRLTFTDKENDVYYFPCLLMNDEEGNYSVFYKSSAVEEEIETLKLFCIYQNTLICSTMQYQTFDGSLFPSHKAVVKARDQILHNIATHPEQSPELIKKLRKLSPAKNAYSEKSAFLDLYEIELPPAFSQLMYKLFETMKKSRFPDEKIDTPLDVDVHPAFILKLTNLLGYNAKTKFDRYTLEPLIYFGINGKLFGISTPHLISPYPNSPLARINKLCDKVIQFTEESLTLSEKEKSARIQSLSEEAERIIQAYNLDKKP